MVLFSSNGWHKVEEHDLKASFVAEAARGGGCDSCDGARSCGRCCGWWATMTSLSSAVLVVPSFSWVIIRLLSAQEKMKMDVCCVSYDISSLSVLMSKFRSHSCFSCWVVILWISKVINKSLLDQNRDSVLLGQAFEGLLSLSVLCKRHLMLRVTPVRHHRGNKSNNRTAWIENVQPIAERFTTRTPSWRNKATWSQSRLANHCS